MPDYRFAARSTTPGEYRWTTSALELLTAAAAAAQLVTDTAAVEAAKASILDTQTILGVTGTYSGVDPLFYTLISGIVGAEWVVVGHVNYTGGAEGTYGAAGPAPATGLPVVERIAANIVATLELVTQANGFLNDVADVVRPNPGSGNDLEDRRLLVIQGDATREVDAPLLYCQWLQEFHIDCMVQESEMSTVSIDQRLNSLAADVEQALTLLTASQQRGGLAEDTLLDAQTWIPAEPAAHEGERLVNVSVRYRTKYNDPFHSIYDP